MTYLMLRLYIIYIDLLLGIGIPYTILLTTEGSVEVSEIQFFLSIMQNN